MIADALSALPQAYPCDPGFLRLGLECATRLGEMEILETVLTAPVRPPPADDPAAATNHAAFDLRRAERLMQTGRIEEAEVLTRAALKTLEAAGDDRSIAIAQGQIADILQARGALDEALRIRREEELPVYERLGDVRSRAVTLQKIGAALIEDGGLQEGRAQEICDTLAEAFGIFRQLGLPDGIAFTGFPLAQVLALGGHREDARRVLDDVDAAFERLGHAEGLAAARGLRGQIDDADRPAG